MKITLLTHFREIPKRSNTGRLVLDVLGDVAEQVCWDRITPSETLLERIGLGRSALVYPGPAVEPATAEPIDHFILIDGTWHEARHIHQRSPYLHPLPRVALRPAGLSRYNLRKNQKPACLCTAECVVELLRMNGRHREADRLMERFLLFIRPEGAMRGQALGS